MKAVYKLIVAGCLLCAAPLVPACDMRHQSEGDGESFEALDKNGDGAISKKEFDAFHSALFRKMDKNKDGKLSQEELEAARGGNKDKCDVSFDERFNEVDINHDGALSKDEAEIGMPMLFAHFDQIDANKDGKITKEEIAADMKKMHENMHERRGIEKMSPGQK